MADRRTDESPLAPRRSLGGSRDGQTRTSDEQQSRTGSEQQRPASSNGQNGSANPQQNQSGNSQQSRPGNASPSRPGNQSPSGAGNPSQSGAGSASQSGTGNAQQNRSGSQQSSQSGDQRQGGGTTTDTRKPMADRVNEKVSGAVSAASETVRKVKDSWPDDRKPGASTSKQGTSVTSGRPAGGSATSSGKARTRKARLRMTHVDPWSVMKIAFLLSIALGIVTVIAVAMVWSVLGAAGVWDSINQTVQEVIGGEDGTAFDVENYVGASRVLGFTMIVAVVDVVLITAIATLGAFLYNLAATLLGGLEVTLAEEEH